MHNDVYCEDLKWSKLQEIDRTLVKITDALRRETVILDFIHMWRESLVQTFSSCDDIRGAICIEGSFRDILPNWHKQNEKDYGLVFILTK